MSDPETVFDSAFSSTVDLGNQMTNRDPEADAWDIADGILAGAIQYWLYSRQPCGDPRCEDCEPVATAGGRMQALQQLVQELAPESEYYHSPTDTNVGRA